MLPKRPCMKREKGRKRERRNHRLKEAGKFRVWWIILKLDFSLAAEPCRKPNVWAIRRGD